jgi:hypothetical protein
MYATNPAVSRDVQLKTFIPESQTLHYFLCCIVAPAQQRVLRERNWSTVQRLPTVLAQYVAAAVQRTDPRFICH